MGKATGKLLHIGVRNKYCPAYTQRINMNAARTGIAYHLMWKQTLF